MEQKRKAFFELEAKRQQRDKEMKHEALEARNRVIEKARKLKFEERDETKTFIRALQHSEVIDNKYHLKTTHWITVTLNQFFRCSKKGQFN